MNHNLKLELMGLDPSPYIPGEGLPLNSKMLTMIGYKRLSNLEFLIDSIIEAKTEGNIIETGVWRGGACIFMSKLLSQLKSDKKIFVADSFEGLPKPDDKYEHDKRDYHHTIDFLSVSLETVQTSFERFNCEPNYEFIKGWFKDTLHLIDSKFSLIRLDGDMYESTINALDSLYTKLVIGGYCVIDDYGEVIGCQHAVTDFRKHHNITDEIINIDGTGIYWQKNK